MGVYPGDPIRGHTPGAMMSCRPPAFLTLVNPICEVSVSVGGTSAGGAVESDHGDKDAPVLE